MKTLEDVILVSRYIQVAYEKGYYTIDANVWLKDISMYTANIRGKGETIEIATKEVADKLSQLDVKQVRPA